jgi:hypothetical protein
MYSDCGYIAVTFVAQLSNPLAVAAKKYLPLTACVRKKDTARVDMFTYTHGVYGLRNLQLASILKGCKSK